MPRGDKGTVVIPDDIQVMSFESALAELENIVQALENGDADLESSIEMYSRGALLKRHCESKLMSASERVEKIITEDGGATSGVATVDMD